MASIQTIRLLVAAAAIELATGVSLYVFPRDYRSDIYAPVLHYFPYLAAGLIAGGLFLLLIVRYAPRPALQRLLAAGAAVPMALLGWYIGGVGGYTGATAYLLLAAGVLAAGWLNKAAEGPPAHRVPSADSLDLFSLTSGAIHLAIGLLMLAAPAIFQSPAFGPVRPILTGAGLLALVAASLLLALPVRRLVPLWGRRLVGMILPGLLGYSFAVTGTWTGVVLWALLAGGCLLEDHPLLFSLRRRTPGAADPDEDWSARTERSLETWTWILMLLVVAVNAFPGPFGEGTLPHSFRFVLILGGYNILAIWLLPPLGSPRLRLHLHLLVIALATGHLLADASSIASSLLPVLLALPMISARASGRVAGYSTLAAVLGLLLATNLAERWLNGLPLPGATSSLAMETTTLAVIGAIGIAAAVDQRRLFQQLRSAALDLASSNGELQAANEELQAQGEELAAQQEALITQHEQMAEQSLLLAAQRDELQASETRFRTAFENAPIGMAMISPSLVILRANRALGEMLGYGSMAGRTLASVTDPDENPSRSPQLAAVLAGHSNGYQVEKRYLRHDGQPLWVSVSLAAVRDSGGSPLYLLAHVVDVTERRRAEEQLRRLANHDPLTDLINRRRFQQLLETALAQPTPPEGRRGAVLFLDFDRFKFVNDTLGHRAGDHLLKGLARVLSTTLGERGSVARLGGDEFGILVPGVDVLRAEEIATEVLASVRSHMEVVAGQAVGTTASIGIALYPEHGCTVEELMLHADMAMYRAKEGGRNRHRFFATSEREAE